MEAIILVVIGIVFVFIGVAIMKGKTQLIHSYHMKNITEETRKPYGRVVGAGNLVIGVGIALDGMLTIVLSKEIMLFTIIGLVIGLVLIFYGQFKYNKGLF